MTLQGQGGSIPLCTAFQETLPEAEIIRVALPEALFLQRCANAGSS